MTTLTFDTYEFIRKLKDVGFSEEQASVITELQKTALQGNREQITHDYGLDNLVSNKDLDARIRETELKIELVRSELKRDIAESKAELIRWVVGVGLLQITIITAMMLKLTAHI